MYRQSRPPSSGGKKTTACGESGEEIGLDGHFALGYFVAWKCHAGIAGFHEVKGMFGFVGIRDCA